MHGARAFLAIGLCAALLVGRSDAATYTIGGSASNVVFTGLSLRLVSDPGCLADGAAFTLQSTDTHDCFAPQNLAKCCSQSIRCCRPSGAPRQKASRFHVETGWAAIGVAAAAVARTSAAIIVFDFIVSSMRPCVVVEKKPEIA